MLSIAQWYLWSQILFLPSLPIALLIFRRLPDRGYPLAKSLGLLLPAFLLWLAASLRLLPNTDGSLLLLWGLLLGAGLMVVWRCWGEVSAFFREQKRTVLATELLFLAAFLLWAVVRAYNPDIQYAEKPMDIGLLNAVLRNRFFPPADPWLSGVTVNYYYFGFVAASLPLRLSGLAPAVGYNLSLALFFALTALGASSLVFNLVRLAGARWRVGVWLGLAGVGLLLLVANLEGALEFIYSRGWGGEGFWRWVGISGLETPYVSTAWRPTDGVWWWRATRIIGSWMGGVQVDSTITEFPFFSFLFGDLHAHIMVMPFSMVTLGLGLAVLVAPYRRGIAWLRGEPLTALALSLSLGALAATNVWNLPPFLLLVVGCLFLRWGLEWGQLLVVGVVVAGSFLLYLPFYLSYSSPVSGLLPWLGPGSRPFHFFLVWGLLLWLVLPFLINRLRGVRGVLVGASLGFVLYPLLLWAGIVMAMALLGDGPASGLARGASRLWLLVPLISLTTAALAGSAGIIPLGRDSQAGIPDEQSPAAFAGLMVFVALLLMMGAEMFYIPDIHGNRVNAVFKLSYQAWMLLSVGSVFAAYYTAVWWKGKGWGMWLRRGWWMVAGLLLLNSLYYPPAATVSITRGFSRQPTLDGLAYLSRSQPTEREAIDWLRRQPGTPVVVEAVGEDYSPYGRISAFTGLPTVLGWPDHQRQWRGSTRLLEGRREAVERIYTSFDRQQIETLLTQYGISYVYVGDLERRRYGSRAGENLRRFLELAFEVPGVAIYRYP
ncbi:MAG: DUF2298 domain-containing protein [Dehalococcoidia bacterium]|nr:DUF2298 domain-containing protein [Dehalococcoidia bacterium]